MTSRLRARTVTANRLQFGVLEAGSGPLALCLHGFPDSASASAPALVGVRRSIERHVQGEQTNDEGDDEAAR
jgi:hypothetical protein